MKKILFLIYFFGDLYFVISGLRLIKTFGETITLLGFLLVLWIIFWSVYKIFLFNHEKINTSFLSYYFNFFIVSKNKILQEKGLGPSKLIRGISAALSLLFGFFALGFILYLNILEITFTAELIIRQLDILSKIVLYPLMILILGTIFSGQNVFDISKKIITFFMFRFVYLFFWVFTFVTPLGYIFIAFLSYLNAKSMELKIGSK